MDPLQQEPKSDPQVEPQEGDSTTVIGSTEVPSSEEPENDLEKKMEVETEGTSIVEPSESISTSTIKNSTTRKRKKRRGSVSKSDKKLTKKINKLESRVKKLEKSLTKIKLRMPKCQR